jgi:hypothetical protein
MTVIVAALSFPRVGPRRELKRSKITEPARQALSQDPDL